MTPNIEQELAALQELFLVLNETDTTHLSSSEEVEHQRLLDHTRYQLSTILALCLPDEASALPLERLMDEPLSEQFLSFTEELTSNYLAESEGVSLDDKCQLLEYELMVLSHAKCGCWQEYVAYVDWLIDKIGRVGVAQLRREERLYLDTFATRLRLGNVPGE